MKRAPKSAESGTLFDIADIGRVRANPILAKEFVKSVPAYELAKIAAAGGFNENVLDETPVIEGILESRNTALELVLLAYGSRRAFGFVDDESLTDLLLKSDAHKAAAFGNPRLDWYGMEIFKKKAAGIAREALLASQDAEQPPDLLRVLATNPRYDRGLLGNVIRGKSPYDSVALARRTYIAFCALSVKEIPSKDYPGKDSPDENELRFSDPLEAFPTLVRDVHKAGSSADFDRFASNFLWQLRDSTLGIEPDDWLTPEEAAAIDAAQGDFMHRARSKEVKAYDKFRSFLSRVFNDAESPTPRAEKDKMTNDEMTGVFAVLLIAGLERSYWLSDAQEQSTRLRKMLKDRCWVLRAAAYAVLFDSIQVGDGSSAMEEFNSRFPDDTFEKWFGVITTDTYADGISGRFESDPLSASVHAESLRAIYSDVHQYLFSGWGADDEADSERRAEMRKQAKLVAQVSGIETKRPTALPRMGTASAERTGTGNQPSFRKKFWRGAWAAFTTGIEVAIALYVLGAAGDKLQTVVLAGLVELYAVIRSLAIGLSHTALEGEFAQISRFLHLARLLNDEMADHTAREVELSKKQHELWKNKTYIQGFGLGIIALAAMYKLITAI